MKSRIQSYGMRAFLPALFLTCCLSAQEPAVSEYAHTLNAGGGVGYYRYVGYMVPVAQVNYELPVDRNLTFAPFAGTYRYETDYYWGDETHVPRYYHYEEKVYQVGGKVTCYFDEWLHAGSRWDFYAAGSLGLIIRKTEWDAEYPGERRIQPGTGPMHLDFHIGTEYRFSRVLGLRLDCSAGATTLGLAFHFKTKPHEKAK